MTAKSPAHEENVPDAAHQNDAVASASIILPERVVAATCTDSWAGPGGEQLNGSEYVRRRTPAAGTSKDPKVLLISAGLYESS